MLTVKSVPFSLTPLFSWFVFIFTSINKIAFDFLISSFVLPIKSPLPFKLQKAPSEPMIMWSKSSIPMIFPASLIRVEMLISSWDGSGSPEGWLWNRIIPAELDRIAVLKISLGWIRELFKQPILTTFRQIRLIFGIQATDDHLFTIGVL